jgi:hypothetical protein
MLFTRWFRRGRRPAETFRPTLCVLEDRTTPTVFPWFPPAGPATHLQVVMPRQETSGQGFDILVEALDASNNLATSYTGTVAVTGGGAGATLPANYPFVARDRGLHVFHVTLTATGSQTLTATDTVHATITGSASTTVNPAPVATHFFVITPSHATQFQPSPVTVVALDASNHRVPNYTGTVTLTSSDSNATLPGSYTFVARDYGAHTFRVTFKSPGAQTVTATDSAHSLSGMASLTVDAVGPVTHFGIFSFGRTLANVATPVLVVALDAANHIVGNYTGMVHFTSGDTGATLPGSYTFTATDNGAHVFSVTFANYGWQSLTVTDNSATPITNSTYIRVTARWWLW